MNRIFRNIRMNSLGENRFGRYLLYAIGEIILVIAGILIALQINNINEKQKNEQRVEALLMDVQRDLLTDLADLKSVIAIYEQKDSLVNLALSDTLTELDYQQNPQLIMLLTTYTAFESKDNAYKNLMRHSDFIANDYDELITQLDEIYLDNIVTIRSIQEEIEELVNSTLKNWSKEYTWYRDLNTGVYNSDYVNYFLNDPFYKNDLVTLRIYASGNLLRMLRRQELLAVQAYRGIADHLQTTDSLPEVISGYMLALPAEKTLWMEGTYQSALGFNMEIFSRNGVLRGRVSGQNSFALYSKSDSLLFNPVIDLKIRFHTQPDGAPGFTFIQNGRPLEFVKAE